MVDPWKISWISVRNSAHRKDVRQFFQCVHSYGAIGQGISSSKKRSTTGGMAKLESTPVKFLVSHNGFVTS